MNDYTPPHVAYLERIANNSETPPWRRELAELHLLCSPRPAYDLPRPATHHELIAAAMMVAGHLKAASMGVGLGEHLTNALYWVKEPMALAIRLAEGGPGDPWAPKIADAMLAAGTEAAQQLGDIHGVVSAGLRKLEMMPCPTCGRSFGDCG